LSDPERHHLSDMTFSPTLRPVDGGVIAAAAERGGVALLRFSNGGGPPRELLTGNRQARGFDVCQASGAIAATVATATSSGEVLVISPSGEERTLSSFGAELEQASGVLPLEEVEARAPDGYPVHGWIVRPPGDGPHPVVLLVHGGPFTQYGYGLFDEAQVYAGAGYAVVMGNPRGSAGYGEVHGRAIVGDFGNLDVLDVLSLLDAALQTDGLDSSRVGVMGGSYGGFMTSWLLTHTDRFRAAISERAVNDFASLVGTSDIGWYFSDLYNGVDPERVREQSPINYVHPGCPPTLIIHSEQDWRTPLEQGQRFYVALKRAGVEAELLLFPGEGHELSRSGRPSHRLQRFAAVLDWWGRHL
jgi:dipeptidyl aminopeptidase/acylaminoacyl peptidase